MMKSPATIPGKRLEGFKGTVQRDIKPPIFLGTGSLQAPYSVSAGFLKFTLNSRRYSLFFIDPAIVYYRESILPVLLL
jgi:hypothetical protein